MAFFLKLKHFELFLLFMMPVAALFIFEGSSYFHIISHIMFVFFFSVLLGWFYATGAILAMKNKISSYSLGLFRLSLLEYFMFILFLGFKSFFKLQITSELIIGPIVLVSLLSIFYSLYFVSKVLLSSEKHAEVEFKDHQLEFLLFFVFIIGIWYLQPRINKLV